MRGKFRSARLLAAFCAAVIGLATLSQAARAASAQDQGQSAAPANQPKPKTQILKFKGEVMASSVSSITVRNVRDNREVMTFSYAPKVREKMQSLIQKGGYQYGDKVTVTYDSGTTVALDISGKPSKPKKL